MSTRKWLNENHRRQETTIVNSLWMNTCSLLRNRNESKVKIARKRFGLCVYVNRIISGNMAIKYPQNIGESIIECLLKDVEKKALFPHAYSSPPHSLCAYVYEYHLSYSLCCKKNAPILAITCNGSHIFLYHRIIFKIDKVNPRWKHSRLSFILNKLIPLFSNYYCSKL